MNTLFSPCVLDTLALKNPLVALPFFTAYANEEGRVTAQVLSHYARIAASGVGLVVVEASTVRDPMAGGPMLKAFGNAHLDGLSELAETIHRHGAKAVLQVCHAGRFGYRPGCLAPSAVPPFGNPDLMPKVMDESDMREVMDAFAEAAELTRQAGFDGVELHGGTGYLLASFTSPHSNHRTDAYGGSVENRARFPVAVGRAVRDKVGGFPVGYRFMAREYIPGGLSLEDGVAIARILAEELKPSYLSVMAGMHECFAMLAEQKQKAPMGFMLAEARAVKQALPQVTVIAAGQLQTREICDQALHDGSADAVGLGRILFADFDWPRKLSGEIAEAVRTCVQCNNCQNQISKGAPAWCSRWTKGQRAEYLRDLPPDRMPRAKAGMSPDA